MKKEDLSVRLDIAKGELKDDLRYENGCFDEIAKRIFLLCFSCEEIVYNGSEDILIQFDNGVHDDNINVMFDAFYLCTTTTEVNFSATDDDSDEILAYSIEQVDREVILRMVDGLQRMCRPSVKHCPFCGGTELSFIGFDDKAGITTHYCSGCSKSFGIVFKQ